MNHEQPPEGYWHWLKVAANMTLPRKSDWQDLAVSSAEVFKDLLWTLALLSARLLILATSPVSVPLIAWWCTRRRKYVLAEKQRRKQALIDSIKGKGPLDGH